MQARLLDPGAIPGPSTRLARLALAVLAVAAAPLCVAALRLFPELELSQGPAWLPPSAALGATIAASAATVALLVRALPVASPPDLLRTAAPAVLAAGGAVTTLAAASAKGHFPDSALAVAAPAAALLLAAATAVESQHRSEIAPLRRRAAAAAALFVGVDAVAAATLLLSPADSVRPWLPVAAAALLGIAAVKGPRLALGLLAGGFLALATSRMGSLEAVVSMAGIGAGAIALAIEPGGPASPASALEADSHGPAAEPSPSAVPLSAELEGADDAARLAHELRGTIAELIQARRTIELQRDEILRSATLDALTGVASRRTILDRLRVEAAEARRYGHPVAVILLDVDGFAAINHEHGMDVGDEVLREVALRLRLRMRAADALGRVGADSFLALLPHTDETGAATFADALQQRLLSRPFDTYEGELRVSASIGVAFIRSGMSLTDEELLAEAETALASARAAGGNRIAFDRMHGLLRLEERRRAQDSQVEQRRADDTR